VWTSAPSLTQTTTNNGDGTVEVCYNNIETLGATYADGDGYARVRVDYDSDGNGSVDQTTFSPVQGYNEVALATFCQTFSNPLLKCEVMSGTVATVSGSNLTVASPTGLTLDPAKCYYAEVISGDQVGQRYRIASATLSGTTLTLAVTSADRFTTVAPAANLSGDLIVVREAYSFNELFPPVSFDDASTAASADNVLAYTPGLGWQTYYLTTVGTNKRWVLSGDNTLADQGATCIEPCQGVFIHRKDSPLTTLLVGEVRANSFACPLVAGNNLVAGGYPFDQSPNDRQWTVANGFTAGRSTDSADQINVWQADANPSTVNQCYKTDFLASSTINDWVKAADSTLAPRGSVKFLEANRAVILNLKTARPNYTAPATWAP
jgi:hypothetical protein